MSKIIEVEEVDDSEQSSYKSYLQLEDTKDEPYNVDTLLQSLDLSPGKKPTQTSPKSGEEKKFDLVLNGASYEWKEKVKKKLKVDPDLYKSNPRWASSKDDVIAKAFAQARIYHLKNKKATPDSSLTSS